MRRACHTVRRAGRMARIRPLSGRKSFCLKGASPARYPHPIGGSLGCTGGSPLRAGLSGPCPPPFCTQFGSSGGHSRTRGPTELGIVHRRLPSRPRLMVGSWSETERAGTDRDRDASLRRAPPPMRRREPQAVSNHSHQAQPEDDLVKHQRTSRRIGLRMDSMPTSQLPATSQEPSAQYARTCAPPRATGSFRSCVPGSARRACSNRTVHSGLC